MFRESQDRDFDNGKIKVISADRQELKLRWIPNNNSSDNNSSSQNNGNTI
jgi:hypothetical protein